MRDGIESQLQDLQDELAEYEKLQGGAVTRLLLSSSDKMLESGLGYANFAQRKPRRTGARNGS